MLHFAAVVVVASGALFAQAPTTTLLPNIDKRPRMRRGQVLERQRVSDSNLHVDWHPVTASPRLIRITPEILTNGALRPANVSGVKPDGQTVVKTFVQAQTNLFGHGPELLQAADVKRDYEHEGLHTIVWQQRLEGIPLYQGIFMANLNRNGQLVNVSSAFLKNIAGAAAKSTPDYKAAVNKPRISADQAIELAAKNIGAAIPKEKLKALRALRHRAATSAPDQVDHPPQTHSVKGISPESALGSSRLDDGVPARRANQ